MKILIKKEYILSDYDTKQISDMCEFVMMPYIADAINEKATKILNRFIHREKTYSENDIRTAIEIINEVRTIMLNKQTKMYEIISSNKSAEEKNTAQHFYDNYKSQLKNLQGIESILTTETEDED